MNMEIRSKRKKKKKQRLLQATRQFGQKERR
jgi:hypothetical protein